MRRHPGVDLKRFAISVVAVAIVASVVPAGLVAISQARFGSVNPLAGIGGVSAASLGEPIADRAVLDGLIRVSLCVIWIAVAVILVTTAVEILHVVRHRGLPTPSIRGLGWAQYVARFIAVGVVGVLPLNTPTATIASTMAGLPTPHFAPETTPVAPARQASHQTLVEQTDRAPSFRHVVSPGESVYSIAESLAGGDSARVIAIAEGIVEANLGASMGSGQRFTNAAYIEVGWVLQVPAEFARSPNGSSAAVHPSSDDTIDRDDAADAATTYEVQPGDTLWDIADDELGDPAAWGQIWEINAGDDMGGGRTFDDPDLILPGWQLRLRDEPAPQPTTTEQVGDGRESTDADRFDEPEEADTPIDAAPSTVAEPSIPGDTTNVADAEVAAPAAPDTPSRVTQVKTPTATGSPTTSTTPAIAARPDQPASGDTENGDTPAPVRLEHAALLAAGILALVAVRRRQRLRAAPPRHRVPERRPELVAAERRIRSIGAGERALRVDVACRAAARHLSESQIGWIEVSPDGDIDLRLTNDTVLPPPWSGTGQDWHLGAEVPIELLSDDARSSGMPCVALAQLGVTASGADLLLDIEACGMLAVDAPPNIATEVVIALGAGLASSMHAEIAHLVTVSLPPAVLLGHRNAHCVETLDEAMGLAAALAGSTVHNERTSFELRALHTGGEVWEPAIVLMGMAAPIEVEAVPVGGHGIALIAPVAPDEIPDAPVRLRGRGDGWTLSGFGSTASVTPVGLAEDDIREIDSVISDAEQPLESIELESVGQVRWADNDAVDQQRAEHGGEQIGEPIARFVPIEHRIVVGLLGGVEVNDVSGSVGQFERSKTVELIAWLATHRDRSTRSAARTALWDLDVRDATFANVVSEARRALARLTPPPDGEEWVARTLSEQLPLHALVVTDADLVAERLDHARLQPPPLAIETLRPAVSMIRDVPFAGTSYLWPDAEGITSNLVLLAIGATTEFASHALSLGDTDGVFWATGQGLRVLPGHEEMIALRMQAHARTGDLAGVRHEWAAYERVLVADAWSDGEPAPKLLALRKELLGSPVSQHRNVP